MKKRQRIIGFAIFLVIVALLYLFVSETITFQWLKMKAHQLHAWAQIHYALTVVVYLLSFFVSSIFFLPLNTLFFIAAGILFGFWGGILWAQIGFCFGSLFSMLFVRYLIGGWVQKKYDHKLEDLNQKIEIHGVPFLLFAQLLPLTPTPLLNMSVGFTTIGWWPFLWTTFAGTIVGNGIYVYAGQFLYQLEAPADIISWPVFIMLILISLLALIPLFFFQYRVK